GCECFFDDSGVKGSDDDHGGGAAVVGVDNTVTVFLGGLDGRVVGVFVGCAVAVALFGEVDDAVVHRFFLCGFYSVALLCAAASLRYTLALFLSAADCSAVSSRRIFAGTPATRLLGGISMPSGTSELAATRLPAPMVAPLRMVAFM